MEATPARCENVPIGQMWTAWQQRRLAPDLSYQGYSLLSLWPSYIVQLPFYAAGSFSSDAHWSLLFANHWAADISRRDHPELQR